MTGFEKFNKVPSAGDGKEEEQAAARSKEWFKHNEGIPFEPVVAEFGFTMEELSRKNYVDLLGSKAAPYFAAYSN